MILLQNTENNKTIELSDSELDAIYSAMSDYEHYGDEEHEIADSICAKLSDIS
jgi:hypothetical protein